MRREPEDETELHIKRVGILIHEKGKKIIPESKCKKIRLTSKQSNQAIENVK